MGIESEHKLPLSDSRKHKALLADVTYSNKLSLEEAPEHARLSRMVQELDFEQISLLPEFRRVTFEDVINLYQQDLQWSP